MLHLFLKNSTLVILLLTALTVKCNNFINNGDFTQGLPQKWRLITKRKCVETKKLLSAGTMIKVELDKKNFKSTPTSLKFNSSVADGITGYTSTLLKLPCGKKYRFSAWYFLATDTPNKCHISGRILMRFKQADRKPKYLFPTFPIKTNKWIQVQQDFFVPPKIKNIAFTLWFKGKGTINWDDVKVEEINTRKVLLKFDWNRKIVENENILIWKASPNLKVSLKNTPILKPGRIKISCARNESEPFQLIIKPQKKLKNISLEFSALKSGDNTLPASYINYNPVGFIYIKTSSNPNIIGWNADPLLNQQIISCEAGKNQPFWIKVYIPENALPGIYHGKILVNSDEKTIYTVPYQVQVRNFIIPKTPSLKTAFYTRFFKMAQFDKRPEKVRMHDAYKQLQIHRITGNQGDSTPLPIYKVNSGKLEITDWTAFDKFINEKSTLYGMRWFRVNNLGFFGDNSRTKTSIWVTGKPFFGYSVISPEGLSIMAQYTQAITEHLKGGKKLNFLNSYIWDEPSDEFAMEAIKKISTAMKKGSSKINIFMTSKVLPELKNIDTWGVPMAQGHFNDKLQKAALAMGQKVWFYNWTVRLDKPNYIQNRLFAWQIYAAGGNGALLWSTLQTYGASPWDEMNRTYDNGAATLMYPPRGKEKKLCASQRFALIKESIDDFDYMKILEERVNRDFPGDGSRRVREIMGALIIKNPFEYKNDFSLLYALRNCIADEIEEAEKAPKVLVQSVPQDNSYTKYNNVTLYGTCPKGASVKLNKQKAFIAESGKFKNTIMLNNHGRNLIKIAITKDGRTKHIQRCFILLQDPNIKRLKNLITLSHKLNVKNISAKKLIKKINSSKKYGKSEFAQVEKTCFELETLCLQQEISKLPDNTNVLKKYFITRARWAFKNNLIERCKYYIKGLKKAPYIMPLNASVTISPRRIDGHQAFILKNNLVSITILESGGRIISFKVKGIECLNQNDLKKDFSEIDRANKLTNRADATTKPILGGFEDAGIELNIWANADWDISFPEISSNKITIAAEFITYDKKFRIRRLMTLKQNDPRLLLHYSIANITPAEFATDDPALNSYNWRGWTYCAINGAPEGDKLIIPGCPAKFTPLYSRKSPKKFSNRAISLSENFIGTYDKEVKTAFGFILPTHIKHVMVWFNSKDNQGYTIEPHRSHVAALKNPNTTAKPFQIKPGKEISFNIYMIGLSSIKDEQQFSNEMRKWQTKK